MVNDKKILMKKLIKDPFTISFIFLAVLVGIFAYLKYQPKFFSKETKSKLIESTDKVNSIKIKSDSEERTALIKSKGQWIVENKDNQPADEDKIDALLSSLEKLQVKETVSKNPDNFKNYNLTKETTTIVELYKEKEKIFEVWVGRAGPTFTNTYFRLPEKEEVYLSNISLRSKAVQSNWLQPTPTPTSETTPSPTAQ